MSVKVEDSALRGSIEAHNDAFEKLLGMIPARYYLVQELTEEQANARLFLFPTILPHA